MDFTTKMQQRRSSDGYELAPLALRTRMAAYVSQSASAISRALGRGGGGVIGGKILLALQPDALRSLKRGREICLVSGTNGKTTTSAFLARALGTKAPVITNITGANLASGIATALAADDTSPIAVLEVDEAVLPTAIASLEPDVVCLLNLSRDQLDRFGEVRKLANRWRNALEPNLTKARIVANADDPLVAWAASGASFVSWVAAGQVWHQDATACPACGGRIVWDERAWQCSSCAFARPSVDLSLENGTLLANDGDKVEAVEPPLPGRCNRSNLLVAATAARALGVQLQDAVNAIARTTEVAGRYSTIQIGSVRAHLLLSKNPAGWVEVFDMLPPEPFPVLIAINARTADGNDPSWLWDVPFEQLGARPVIASGDRAQDLAVRLRYANIACSIGSHNPISAVSEAPFANIEIVANYTAFQSLLKRAKHGDTNAA